MSEPVHIVQCLCPSRHAILAIAYLPRDLDSPRTAEDYLRETVARLVAAGIMNARCGICKSANLRYEDSATRFQTMAEAEPELRRIERECSAARMMFGQAAQN